MPKAKITYRRHKYIASFYDVYIGRDLLGCITRIGSSWRFRVFYSTQFTSFNTLRDAKAYIEALYK